MARSDGPPQLRGRATSPRILDNESTSRENISHQRTVHLCIHQVVMMGKCPRNGLERLRTELTVRLRGDPLLGIGPGITRRIIFNNKSQDDIAKTLGPRNA